MKILKYHTGPLDVNTYYALDESSGKGFIVDPGGFCRTLADKIKEDGAEIQYIILTHGHFDHVEGVPDFLGELPEVKIVASKFETNLAFTPDIRVDDGDTLNVGHLELKFIFTPGHTPGGMCVLAEGNLFSGDTLFRRSVGRTDFPGSSHEKLMGAIHDKLFTLPDNTRVLPGHMDETEIGYEKEHNPFV